MKFTLTLNQDQIQTARNQVVNRFVQNTTLKGFRKGKAPKAAVINHVGEEKIIEATINQALPAAYAQAVKAKNLKPITFPQITPKSIQPHTDWEFEVEIAQMPQVKLGNYQQAVKQALSDAKSEAAKNQIWTPDKATPDSTPQKPDPQTDQKQQLDAVFSALLKTCQLTVPQLLIKEEVDRQLSQLIDQVNRMGMKVDDYLKAKGATLDSLKHNYQHQAEQTLALEFILLEITKDLNIQATDSDLKPVLANVKDQPKPQQLSELKTIITRRKTIERLLALA